MGSPFVADAAEDASVPARAVALVRRASLVKEVFPLLLAREDEVAAELRSCAVAGALLVPRPIMKLMAPTMTVREIGRILAFMRSVQSNVE